MSTSLSLEGKRGIVLCIANRHSIAYGIAEVLSEQGAELCITYLNEKSKPFVAPLAEKLTTKLFLPCDVSKPDELEAVFAEAKNQWGTIDFVIHSIAWSPLDELHGRLVDSSSAGFSLAMDISCHSFIRTARLAEAQMKDNGGTLITMTYYGSEKVVNHYGIMGPIKAALESSVRYMASELGATRAGSGITDFDGLMDDAVTRSPLHRLGKPEDVGRLTAFLISDWAASQTGSQMFVDAGHYISMIQPNIEQNPLILRPFYSITPCH